MWKWFFRFQYRKQMWKILRTTHPFCDCLNKISTKFSLFRSNNPWQSVHVQIINVIILTTRHDNIRTNLILFDNFVEGFLDNFAFTFRNRDRKKQNTKAYSFLVHKTKRQLKGIELSMVGRCSHCCNIMTNRVDVSDLEVGARIHVGDNDLATIKYIGEVNSSNLFNCYYLDLFEFGSA